MKYIVYYKDDFGEEHQTIAKAKRELVEGEKYKIQIDGRYEYKIERWEKIEKEESNKRILLY